MKTCGTIICSLVGGAILGSAATILLAPKVGEEIRNSAHGKILSHLHHIHQHLKELGCTCSIDGECQCGEMNKENAEGAM